MNILLWIIFGSLVGWVASLIVDTDESQDIVLDVVVGVVGAFLGGMVTTMLGLATAAGFDLFSFAAAIVGSIILVSVVHSVKGTGRSRVYPV